MAMVKIRKLPASCGNNNNEKDQVDRISKLPDELIHHIMSFIDTKYAVQTSVLSKRWIPVWKSLPSLDFHRSSFSHANTKRFVDFVYMVFLFRDNINIQRFTVDWKNSAYDDSVIPNINRWWLNAVKCNVQEIIIKISHCHNSPYEIPHQLLNCKSLQKLVIQVFESNELIIDIILPRSMNLPRLKELRFFGLSVSNIESSKRLFSSCPVLENLVILNCNIQTDNGRCFIADSLSLKKFVYGLYHRRRENNTNIKLCAPNVKNFICASSLIHDFSLEVFSPLSWVKFYMILETLTDENAETYSKLPLGEKEVYAKRMMKHLASVYMVKTMILSSGILEVLSQALGTSDSRPLRLCNLQHLTLDMWFTRGCLRSIAYLLSISPNIVSVCLRLNEWNLAEVGDDWGSGLSFQGMLSQLQFVQIEEVEGCDNELKFLSFLLKNATALKKVVLYPRSTMNLPEQFRDKLRALPRSSARIIFIGRPAANNR